MNNEQGKHVRVCKVMDDLAEFAHKKMHCYKIDFFIRFPQTV